MSENVLDLVKEIQNVTSLEGPYVSIDFWSNREGIQVYVSGHEHSYYITSQEGVIDYLTNFLKTRKILFRQFSI